MHDEQKVLATYLTLLLIVPILRAGGQFIISMCDLLCLFLGGEHFCVIMQLVLWL